MAETFIKIAIILAIAIPFLLWNSGNKVQKTFFCAIDNARDYILSDPQEALKEFYIQPNHPRKNYVEAFGMDSVLETSSNEEIRTAISMVMAYYIFGAVSNIYKHQSEQDVFRMLHHNPKISEKFKNAIYFTAMQIRGK